MKMEVRLHLGPGLAHKLCFPLLLVVWVTWTLELDFDQDVMQP